MNCSLKTAASEIFYYSPPNMRLLLVTQSSSNLNSKITKPNQSLPIAGVVSRE